MSRVNSLSGTRNRGTATASGWSGDHPAQPSATPKPANPLSAQSVLRHAGRFRRGPVLHGLACGAMALAAWLGPGASGHAASYGHSGSVVLSAPRRQASSGGGVTHSGAVALARKRAQASRTYSQDGHVTPSPAQDSIVLPVAARESFQIVFPLVRAWEGRTEFRLWLTTKPGVGYQLHRSEDYNVWTAVREFIGRSGAVEVHDFPPAGGRAFFYRAIERPD